MITVIVCEYMHWDYHTFMQQPNWFVDLIIEKIQIDNKKSNAKSQKGKKI